MLGTPLAVTLYRSMLRVLRQPASKLEGRLIMSFIRDLKTEDTEATRALIAERSARHKAFGAPPLSKYEHLPAALRHEFDAGKGTPEEFDNCFRLLRDINIISSSHDENREQREERTMREGIEFSVGEVVKHKKYGYRMVVYGWDSLPRMGVRQWDGVQDLPSGADQAFYFCLPDQEDTRRKFGAPRSAKYVAGENMERVTDERLLRVHHPLMGRYFDGFNPDAGVFVPNQRIQRHFPDSYAKLVTAPEAQASSERLLCNVSALQGALALRFQDDTTENTLSEISIEEGTSVEPVKQNNKMGGEKKTELKKQGCGEDEGARWWETAPQQYSVHSQHHSEAASEFARTEGVVEITTHAWADASLVEELLELGGCTSKTSQKTHTPEATVQETHTPEATVQDEYEERWELSLRFKQVFLPNRPMFDGEPLPPNRPMFDGEVCLPNRPMFDEGGENCLQDTMASVVQSVGDLSALTSRLRSLRKDRARRLAALEVNEVGATLAVQYNCFDIGQVCVPQAHLIDEDERGAQCGQREHTSR
jgi:hemimethylated DNA binding protein